MLYDFSDPGAISLMLEPQYDRSRKDSLPHVLIFWCPHFVRSAIKIHNIINNLIGISYIYAEIAQRLYLSFTGP